MKLTIKQLRTIIKEEVSKVVREGSYSFHPLLTKDQFVTNENLKWVHGILNQNGMWSMDESSKILNWLWKEYDWAIDAYENNPGLKEIRGEIYTTMEDGVIPLGYSYDSLLEDLDDLLNKMNSFHEETGDDHGVDLNELADKFFCE